MEYAQINYNHEYEVRGLYVSMGNGEKKSNGHGEGKEEIMNLVETIKSLQRYVQRYKADNERLMKSKEKQDGFNIKILQILDKIEKKMDKETKSNKSRSHRSHAKIGEYGSSSRHHHHSPRHSLRLGC
jgi:predicted RNase H-like nuclease (RuvC/YqgF family)